MCDAAFLNSERMYDHHKYSRLEDGVGLRGSPCE